MVTLRLFMEEEEMGTASAMGFMVDAVMDLVVSWPQLQESKRAA